MTIFQSAPYASPSASNIFCAEYWVAFTVFRELAVSTTSSGSFPCKTAKKRIYELTASQESSTISTSSRTNVPSTTAPSTTGFPTTAAPTVAASATATLAGDSQTMTGSQSSPSRGWIAGAVIGSVAATAIIAGLIGWFAHLRKKAQQLSVKEESIARQSLPYHQSTHKEPQEIDTTSNPSNLFVHELGSYGYK